MLKVEEKKRANYLNVTQQYQLELAIAPLWIIFRDWGHYGIYQVGSTLTRANWRDVDIRMMMEDSVFDTHFLKLYSPHHLFLNACISKWLTESTDLPIDFQFQRTTDANVEFGRQEHKRNCVGIRIEVT